MPFLVPGRRRFFGSVLISNGPDAEWFVDGHDKMTDLGFPIHGITNKFSGKILSMSILSNNRNANVADKLFLDLCKKLTGKFILISLYLKPHQVN